jgi:integrase
MFSGHDIPESWAGHKDRRLEGDEETKLLEAASKSLKNADEWKRTITILLETGMRAQEFLKSTYDNLSLDGRTLFLPAEIVKKTGRGKVRKGKARHVPLSLKAVEAYKEQTKTRKDGEPRIFWQWKDTSSFDKAFKRISTRAGCPEVMPHTLRHEATARLFEKNKLSDMQIMKILGHSSMTTLAGYYQYRPQGIALLLD